MQEIIRIMADGLVVPVVLMAAWALLFRVPKGQRQKVYSWAIVGGLVVYMLAKIIAALWQPDAARPFEQLGVAAGAFYLQNAGFPSDHALFCSFLTITVYFLTNQKKLAVCMAVLTILVSLGRVLALVHTPLDVIGGIGIASFAVLVYLQYKRSLVGNHSSVKRKNVVQ